MRFVGRGRDTRDPAALRAELSGTTGAVLDPCVSLRRGLAVAPGETATVSLGLGGARSRDAAAGLAEAFGTDEAVRAAVHSAPDAEAACRAANGFDDGAVEHAQSLVGALVYGDPSLRAPADILADVTAQGRAPHEIGVTGSGPLVVVEARTERGVDVARALAAARACWTDKGLATRLAVVTDQEIDGLDAQVLYPADLSDADRARLAADAHVWADDALPEPDDAPALPSAQRTAPPRLDLPTSPPTASASGTGRAGSAPTARSTSSTSRPTPTAARSCRRCRGPTSSPTRRRGPWSRRRARRTPGRPTAGSTGCRRGTTTRSRTRTARRSTSRTSTLARCGRPRPAPRRRTRRTRCATASA